MRKKIVSKVMLSVFCVCTAFGFAGCEATELSKEDEALVVEYVANVVINHDNNYIVKMAHREKEEETKRPWIEDDGSISTEKQTSDENADSNQGADNKEEETTKTPSQNSLISVNEAFGIAGISVESAGYTVGDKYPEGNDGFSMVATKGYDLLVLKFNVKNSTAENKNLDMTALDYNFRCIVNTDKKLNAQITALVNALNTWNGVIEAGSTKELILVFQVNEEVSKNIESIKLSVIKDEKVKQALIK